MLRLSRHISAKGPLALRCNAPIYKSASNLLPTSSFSPRFSSSIATVDLAYEKYEVKRGVGSGREVSKGTEHHVHSFEKKDPIIFIHGLFGSKQTCRTVFKVISRNLGRTVYLLDMRNHGDSPHIERHDYTAMSEDVRHFMKTHKIDKSVVIGHSMGAKVAMALALESPQLVSRLIPVDNSPIDAALGGNFLTYVDAMIRIAHSKPKKSSEMYKIMSAYEPNLAVQQFLLTNFTKNHKTGYYEPKIALEYLRKAIAYGYLGSFPYHPDKYQYKGPTMFVRGTESPYVADEAFPVIGQFFPKFICKDIKAGHWLISEKPDEFIRDVTEFLEGQESD